MRDSLVRLNKPPLKRAKPLDVPIEQGDDTLLLRRKWAQTILVHWAATKLKPSIAEQARSTTNLFVLRCKTIICFALKRWINNKRRSRATSTSVETSEHTRVATPELDWVVPALLSNEKAAAFEFCSTVISADNVVYFVEMYVWILANTSAEQSSEICLHLHKLLLQHSGNMAKVTGIGRLVERNVLELMERCVESELPSAPSGDMKTTNTSCVVQLATLLLLTGDIDVFLSVALIDGLSGYNMSSFEYDTLCKLRDTWRNSKPQLTNSSTASALLLLSSRLRPSIADCFPYCKALNFALEQVTLAATQQHPTASVTVDDDEDDEEGGHHHHMHAVSIQLIRAPTQEEYFRTSLRDPVLSLRCINANNHPLVSELVQQIATELETDAELLELICCNKILKGTLDLNQVYEKLWKPFVRARRRTSISSNEDIHHGMLLQHDMMEDEDDEEGAYDDEDFDDEVMAIIYRIVAIDGEASEDFLTELPNDDEPAMTEKPENEVKPEVEDLGFPLTKALSGEGFQSVVVLFHMLTAQELDWPRDLRCELALTAFRLLECSALANLQELQTCGIIPALLKYLFCFAKDDDEACKLCLQVLEQVCKHFKFTENGDPGYLEQVVQHLDALEQYKPSVSRLLPRLTGQQSTKAAELITLLPSTWLESVLFECNDEEEFLRACYVGGITQTCVDTLHIDSISQESALRSLKLLKGLAREAQSAMLVCQQHASALRELVLIEEVPNAKVPLVGDLAGAVLELLSAAFPFEVHAQQQARRSELAAMSTKKRQKKERAQLRKQQKMTLALPMQFEDSAAAAGEAEIHPKDRVLRCCVCYEGYQAKPDALLCTYVYCKQVPSQTMSSSVSSFVLIHSACHDKAFSTEGELRQARDEWEGAQIRNGHAACNNLLPVLLKLDGGGALLPTAQYNVAQKKYFDRLGVAGNKADFVAKDIRLLLLRIAFEESLIVHTGGGSIESNLQLVVPLLQLACHNLDDEYLFRKGDEKDVDRQLAYNLVKAKAATTTNEAVTWTETRTTSFKLFIRWAEQTTVHGSTLVQPPKQKLKLKPWYVFFGMIDFMMDENRFLVYKQDVYEMLDTAQAFALFVRKLIALPSLDACCDMLKLPKL